MAPKVNIKKKYTSAPNLTNPMGSTPASMLHRVVTQRSTMCPKIDIEFDPYCDPDNPIAITLDDIVKAQTDIKEIIPVTPLRKSWCCDMFDVELYYKIESYHPTGSYSERGALNALLSLTSEQVESGVVCASLGNFGLALAYHAKRKGIKARVVYPVTTHPYFVNRCKEYGGKVTVKGANFMEARHEAFVLAHDIECTFINGYDHPAVIAGSGTIGLEIMEELPEVDVVLVPIGGGGLIAGVAEAVKRTNPDVMIYGVEPDKCCSFFKAMERDDIVETDAGHGIAQMLGLPTAGCNAFYSAKPLINKLTVVDDDWIARAIAHLAEEEKMVIEGAGATTLGALFAMPKVLKELSKKTVVCILTGSNIEYVMTLPRCLDRARAIDGRLIKLTMHVDADDTMYHTHVMSMIANTGCNVLQCHIEHAWITNNDLQRFKMHLMIATRNLEHACTLKRVMLKLFPNQCDFMEEPFSPIPVCVCYPKKPIPFKP